MSDRMIKGDCSDCESEYVVNFIDELVSDDKPEFCPFCGSRQNLDLEEGYIEDDDEQMDEEEWN